MSNYAKGLVKYDSNSLPRTRRNHNVHSLNLKIDLAMIELAGKQTPTMQIFAIASTDGRAHHIKMIGYSELLRVTPSYP